MADRLQLGRKYSRDIPGSFSVLPHTEIKSSGGFFGPSGVDGTRKYKDPYPNNRKDLDKPSINEMEFRQDKPEGQFPLEELKLR